MKEYSDYDAIPRGRADSDIVQGCAVLEGGAFRGLYTQGVLDALMEEDINLQTTVGVSAGAMSGMNYVSGQIGRSARYNLAYRHDRNYIGIGAMRREHGITGFHYLFEDLDHVEPFDTERFNDPSRRFIAQATDIETGLPVYFEKGKCSSILDAVAASASVPYITEPVEIDGRRYLDGGCAVKIPVDFALKENFEKILVVRTRNRDYRKTSRAPERIIRIEYKNYPEFKRNLQKETDNYNALAERLLKFEEEGRIFMIAPDTPVNISRFEGDLEKLGDLYWQGYYNARDALPALKHYLGI